MLRKLSTLALAALLSLSPIIGSSQSMSDTTKTNKSYGSSTKMKTGKMTKKVMHRKHHKKTAKKALYKRNITPVKPSGTY